MRIVGEKMNKGVRRVRKSINKRKKLREFPNERNRKHVEEDITPAVFPQEEEKHGVYPSFFDNLPTKTNTNNRFISIFLLKGILSVILFLSVAMIWKTDWSHLPNVEKWTSQALTEEFPFAKMNHWYKTTFGHPLSLRDRQKEETRNTNPVALPVSGPVAQTFQDNGKGIMIAPEQEINVSALEEGIVIFAGNDQDTERTVTIQHPDGSQTTYGYLETIDVHLYQFIASNQVIGQFTPTKENEWVYFSIKQDSQYIDPAQVIKVDDRQ